MKNKGFTLVELMVTIVIIGLVSFLGFPALMRIVRDNVKKEMEYYGESMIGAAKLYMQKEGRDIMNSGALKYDGDTFDISLDLLEQEKYIEPFKSSKAYVTAINLSKDGEEENALVVVTLVDADTNTYSYKYQFFLHDKVRKKVYIKRYNQDDILEVDDTGYFSGD